jgi:hypothetical protein
MTTRRIAATTDDATLEVHPTHPGAASDDSDRATPRRGPSAEEYDVVDDSGAASFPASDPPSWWGGA